MKGTRHSEEQIIAILKQGEAGLTTAELCRQHGITEQTYSSRRRRSATSPLLCPLARSRY
jgi:putative transposase